MAKRRVHSMNIAFQVYVKNVLCIFLSSIIIGLINIFHFIHDIGTYLSTQFRGEKISQRTYVKLTSYVLFIIIQQYKTVPRPTCLICLAMLCFAIMLYVVRRELQYWYYQRHSLRGHKLPNQSKSLNDPSSTPTRTQEDIISSPYYNRKKTLSVHTLGRLHFF